MKIWRLLLSLSLVKYWHLSKPILVHAFKIKQPFNHGSPGFSKPSSVNASTDESNDSQDDKLFEYKKDLANIPGAWNIFLPFQLHQAVGFSPNADLRPCPFFFDVSGRVSGPQNSDSPAGAFILDAGDLQTVDKDDEFIRSRRFI
ncbi:hypothetical protein BdWA1_002003 [Babesia duncani]|uniref:Uncharacterized protein n=1 Tax=Babesia duncani TaxID=323732 RepID=A0AAD9PKY1_9APIC|nr:hypothetical protein BdWA1_002003 [Babesia duncani]